MEKLSPEFVASFSKNFAQFESSTPASCTALLSAIERLGERDSLVDWWSDNAERNIGPMSPTKTTHSATLATCREAAGYAIAFWSAGDQVSVDVLEDGAVVTVSGSGRLKSRCVVLKTRWGSFPSYYPFLY